VLLGKSDASGAKLSQAHKPSCIVMAWQGTLLDTQHFDPALKPKTIARPTKSRHLWKRLNPGHMTQLWDTSQRVCQNDEQREEQMNQFAFNAHLRKTDINTYANAYARQYPRLDN